MLSIRLLNNFKQFNDSFLKYLPAVRRHLVSFNSILSSKQVKSASSCLSFINNKCAHFSIGTNQYMNNWEQILTEDFCKSLWSKQTDLLKSQKESNRFNYEEFMILVNELKNDVIYSEPKSKISLINQFKTLIKIFLICENNFQIGSKLGSDSKNWTVFVNILDELLGVTLNKDRFLLEPFMVNLMTAILQAQIDVDKNSSYPTTTCQFKPAQIPDENYFYFQLVLSYFEYLRENKKEIKDSVFLYFLKSYSCYLESILERSSKDFIQLCKEDKTFMNHYENFNNYLELFMQKHPNFYSLSQDLKEEFFQFFSFNKEKWSISLKLIQNDAQLRIIKIIYHSIIGSIRYNDRVHFEWLCGLLKDRNFEQHNGWECQNTIDKFSIEFLKVKIKYLSDLEDNLELLLETWQKLSHWPTPEVIHELKKFINEINYRKSEREGLDRRSKTFKLTNIQVNYKGTCSNGFRLPIIKYDNQNLLNMAKELRKTKLPSCLKESFQQGFDELDNCLKNKRFDYIIDGMNIIYLSNRYQIGHLNSLLELLDKRKSKLIVLKKHLQKPESSIQLEKIKKMHSNVKLVYFENRLPDDRFVLYAAMLSGNETFIVSNDNYQDSLFEIQNYKNLFKSWFINRRIICHNYFNKLYYPPLFNVNVNKVDENNWLVPYLNEKRASPYDEPKLFMFISKTN